MLELQSEVSRLHNKEYGTLGLHLSLSLASHRQQPSLIFLEAGLFPLRTDP